MERKSVRFDLFLEKFLYGTSGYYTQRGFEGRSDFITAPQKSAAFVKFICTCAREIASCFLKDAEWSFVELGAGDGEVSTYFASTSPQKRVYAVEISAERRRRISESAKNIRNLIVMESVRNLPEDMDAVVFANEFFDALPVRVFRKGQKAIEELYYDESRKVFLFKEPESSIPEAVLRFLNEIPEKTVFEYESGLDEIFQKLARMKKTTLIIVDYGYRIADIERFKNGTLVGFYRHRFINEPLEAFDRLSSFDVTHQVNFSFLSETARRFGFEEAFCTGLGRFILENFELVEQDLNENEKLELLKIALPHNFGDAFKVLILTKKDSGRRD